MSERRWWIGIVSGGLLCAAGLGTVIYLQYEKIAEGRTGVATLKQGIEGARKLIEGTSTLERDVIVLRELSEVMKGILPDTEDVNNLVRTLQKLSEDSGVRISGLKKKTNDTAARDKTDFDKVAYTLQLEGDAFQFLDFLDLIETHSRFMKVPTLHITAAQRTQLEKEGVPAHKVTLDVETYVYEPKKDAKPVKIDGYDRKRDLLLGEINRRREGLSISTYSYRGARGRRDPWIDPRVPAQPDNPSQLTVQQQMDMVQEFVEKVQTCTQKWAQVKVAENVIVEMMARQEVEEMLTNLEEDLRRVVSEKTIVYVPSARRLQNEVLDVVNDLRNALVQSDAGKGPSESQLRDIQTAMVHHQDAGEFKLMLDAFSAIENRLALVENDPLKKPLVDKLKLLAYEARTVMDFDKIKIEIDGVVLIEGLDPIAIVNGRSLGVGDTVGNDIVIRAIRRDEIELIFREVVFARRF